MFSNLSTKVSFLTDLLNACSFYIGCDRIDDYESFSHLFNAKLGVSVISLSVVMTL